MASENSQESVSLEISLSRSRKRNVSKTLSLAEAEFMLSSFDVGRVSMIVKVNGRPHLAVMECRKGVRH